MLSSYTCADSQRYGISWPGWIMSGTVITSGQVQGLHDQDFIHNRKKLINPLDSPVRNLQFGGDICCLEHLGMVYNKFSYDEHGLSICSKNLPAKGMQLPLSASNFQQLSWRKDFRV
jgi:hypothetical protein